MGELVELDVTTVEESVTVNVTEEGQVQVAVFAEKGDTGPAGPAGPNSVTSATTSDGTAELEVLLLTAAEGITANRGVNETSAIYADGGNGNAIYATSEADAVTIASDNGTALTVTSNTGNDIAVFRDASQNGINIENPRGWLTWVYEPGEIYLGRLKTADITDDREWTLPNASGTLALTEDYTDGTATIDVLDATVQGTLTADHIHGNLAGSVYAHIRAGENLAKGDPVYISGSHGSGANLIAIVSKADASNAAKMPAVGVMDAAVTSQSNGHMVITGTITELNTNAFPVNTVLYVATGGGWTSTPPAANSQAVAIVERSNTNNGAVIVKVNGLGSSGGNGAADANKLVRYNSTGGASLTGGTLTDMTYAGTAAFTSTTRPTSAGTGTPAATSLITANDIDLQRLKNLNYVVSNFTGATAVAGGGAAALATLLYSAANSSTTTGNYYTFRVGSTFFAGNAAGDRTTANFSRRIVATWDILVITSTATNTESRYLWPVNSTYTTGRLTNKGLGFIVIGQTIYGCAHDGTTHRLTTGLAVTGNTLQSCTVISDGSGNASFYVNGTLIETIVAPTGTLASIAREMALNTQGGGDGVSQWFACQQFQLSIRH